MPSHCSLKMKKKRPLHLANEIITRSPPGVSTAGMQPPSRDAALTLGCACLAPTGGLAAALEAGTTAASATYGFQRTVQGRDADIGKLWKVVENGKKVGPGSNEAISLVFSGLTPEPP